MSENHQNTKLERARNSKTIKCLRQDLETTKKISNMNTARAKKSAEQSSYNSSETGSREMSPLINDRQINVNFNNCKIQNVNVVKNQKITNTQKLIANFGENFKKHIYAWRWHYFVLTLFATVYAISPNCFYLFNNTIITPSDTTIKKFLRTNRDNVIGSNDIEKINSSIIKYKETNDIHENEIFGILAVDAVSTEPVVKVSKNGEVKGLISPKNLTKEEIIELQNEVRKQESFVKQVKNITVSSAFVYQWQPLNPVYPCSVIYIEPSTNGKANSNQIKILERLKESLDANGFKVVAFSTDGDSGYRPLVKRTLNEFSEKKEKTVLKSNETLYSNDPLHILKRARYRLLTHNFTFLNVNENIFNFHPLVELLNLPGVLFDNSRITKMQDSFPLKLFTLKNLKLMHNIGLFQHTAYFLPFVLLNTVLTYEKLLINERVDLIEISINYLNIYKNIVSSSNSKLKAPQKSNKTSVLLFDTALMDDLITTLLTLNTIICTQTGAVSLNRIGTNPLEHHFGLLRLRSKYKHNFENMIKQQNKIELMKTMEKEMTANIIKNRKKTYGVTIFLDKRRFAENQNFRIAQALLQFYGIPVKTKMCKEAMDILVAIFMNKIEQFGENEKIYKNEYVLNSKEIKLSPSMGAYIQKRQESANIKSEYFQVSNDDFTDNYNENIHNTNGCSSDSESTSNDDDDFVNVYRMDKRKNKKLSKSASQPSS